MNEAFSELEKIYISVDVEISQLPYTCSQCGTCCNFRKNGMRLYIYAIERMYLLDRCPMMLCLQEQGNCNAQKNNICTTHLVRPLGCRTYFCEACKTLPSDRAKDMWQEIYEKYAKKILELENKYNIPHHYGQAFANFEY